MTFAVPIDPALKRQIDQSESEIDVQERLAAEKSLYTFSRLAWPILNPGTTFLPNWHIKLICEYLMLVTRGDILRLIINMPPRYMKSLLVSVFWPCWEWVNVPSKRRLFVSYSGDLSKLHSDFRRKILLSAWYQSNWGHIVKLCDDHNRIADYMNDENGSMYSSSISGTTTGMGGDLVIDDPTNPKKAQSTAEREYANSWYYDTGFSRLDDKKKGTVVLIQQRLHQVDMTGFLTDIDSSELSGHLMQKNGWTLLRFPLIAEEDEEIVFPISGKVITRKSGDLLWLDREGPEQIVEYQRDPFVFASQLQQRPTQRKGSIFQRDWFKDHLYTKIPVKPDVWILSLDATYKKMDDNDFVALGVWGWKKPNMYLDHLVVERLGFNDTKALIKETLLAYPAISAKVIEEKANGAAIIDSLQTHIGGFIPINPDDSKVARASAVVPYFQAGNVWIKAAPWTHHYIKEMINFPKGHDDQVDMTSQAILYLMRTFGGLKSYKESNRIRPRFFGHSRT